MQPPTEVQDTGFVDRKALRSICGVAEQFWKLSPTMPVGEVVMFITVALNEGASLTELAALLDMKKATASRYLLDLSDKLRTGEKGYGLISRETDPAELRRNMYSLTAKGRSLVKQLASVKTLRD
jgi:DNA-binding MarR family transcriptional regulator